MFICVCKDFPTGGGGGPKGHTLTVNPQPLPREGNGKEGRVP